MMNLMAQPYSPELPPELGKLVEQLTKLGPDQRSRVIDAAQKAANDAKRWPTMPWDIFEKSHGIVSLGGDAVVDCEMLYDG
jgi:hypothetical protein